MKRTQKFAVAAGLAALLCTTGVATVAFATAGSGNTVPSDMVSGILDGSSNGPAKVSQDGIELKTKTETEVATFDLLYPPLSFSGWHSHPGIVIVVVKEGKVVRQTGCAPGETFEAGDAFTEVGPHYVSNPSDTERAVLSITRVYPESMPTIRIDEAAPVCR